ncbi:hypothetical protein [Crossiella sp. CA198]|uniref:hypothetical protein n=1 Tax=Crossiella sp. CA198 TaxID=3455607 RepID=UPI003F8D6752
MLSSLELLDTLDRFRDFVATPGFHRGLTKTLLDGLPTELPSPEEGLPVVEACVRFQERLLRELVNPPLLNASSETTALAKSGGAVLPRYHLHSAALPAPRGLLIFDDPVDRYVAPTGIWPRTETIYTEIIAIMWMPASRRGENGVQIVMLSDQDKLSAQYEKRGQHELAAAFRACGRLGYDGEAFLPFAELDIPVLNPSIRALMSTWLLMRSRTIVERTVVTPPKRHQRRRERAGQSAEVTMVTLRGEISRVVREIQSAPDSGGCEDGARRSHTFRWPVSGHWRRWYFAKEQQVDLIPVAPCIKGPEGAPLRVNKKLFRLMLDKPALHNR